MGAKRPLEDTPQYKRRGVHQKLIGIPEFVSLVFPEQVGAVQLSLETARHVAHMHLSDPDACAACFDATGKRLSTSPGYAEFFDLSSDATSDRQRGGKSNRESWLAERNRFAQMTALTCKPVRVIEIAGGFRVESFFTSVQDADLPSQLVLQTSRRVIRCGTDGPPKASGELAYALHATWGTLDQLSRRQLEVLRLVTKGMGNDQIGASIGRTKRAVEWHIRGLFAKLKVSDRVFLHVIGMRAGLDDLPDDVWNQILIRRYGASTG